MSRDRRSPRRPAVGAPPRARPVWKAPARKSRCAGRATPAQPRAPRDLELPPWSKGRYGTAIGRAVHGVLQVVDLATGAGLEAAVAAQCLAEGVLEFTDVVDRVGPLGARRPTSCKRAAAREHWRESYVGTVQPDGTVLEGFVDLIYREDDGR